MNTGRSVLMLPARAGLILLTGACSLVLNGCGAPYDRSKYTTTNTASTATASSTATDSKTATTSTTSQSSVSTDSKLTADHSHEQTSKGPGWQDPLSDSSSSGNGWGGAQQKTSLGDKTGDSHAHFCQHASSSSCVPNPGPVAIPSGDLSKTPEKDRPLSTKEIKYKEHLASLVLLPSVIKKKFADRPMAAPSYQIAKDHPDILRRLFCYCGCDIQDDHTTLLDCFTATDEHGATCSECVDEAFLADKLYNDGATMARIQRIVDEQFCGKYPFPPRQRSDTYKNYLAHRLYTDSTEPLCGDKYSQ